jgi:hypothetical protein
MAWMRQHKNWVLLAVFVLLLIAILGPWGYEGDGVPPPEFCHPPFILLENGNCVGRMSGAFILHFSILAIPSLISQLLSGTLVLSERGREFLFILPPLLLVVLPVTSTLLRIKSPNNRSIQIFSVITWGLAIGLGCLIAAFAEVFHPAHLWGVWLYLGLAGAMLVWELLTLTRSIRKPSPAEQMETRKGIN